MLGLIPPLIPKDANTIDKKNDDQKNKKELKYPSPINPVIVLITMICISFVTFFFISS